MWNQRFVQSGCLASPGVPLVFIFSVLVLPCLSAVTGVLGGQTQVPHACMVDTLPPELSPQTPGGYLKQLTYDYRLNFKQYNSNRNISFMWSVSVVWDTKPEEDKYKNRPEISYFLPKKCQWIYLSYSCLRVFKSSIQKRNEQDQALYPWTPRFEFSNFFMCCKNIIFLLMIFQLLKKYEVCFQPTGYRVGVRLPWPAGCSSPPSPWLWVDALGSIRGQFSALMLSLREPAAEGWSWLDNQLPIKGSESVLLEQAMLVCGPLVLWTC